MTPIETITSLWQSISFILVIIAILVGVVGAFVPILPGSVIVWLALLVYNLLNGWQAITPALFILCTLICIVTGSATIWLSLVGAKTTGASGKSLVLGMVGAVIGLFVFNLLGAIAGYALGIIVGEYLKEQDWKLALKASLGGLAGWGIATAIEAGGSLLILIIFVARVLTVG